MAQYAVIGLGRFGGSTAEALIKMNHSVSGVDSDPNLVDHYAELSSRAAVADASDKEALEELGLANFDGVLVAIGESFEASLVCVVHLKSLGVNNIWVKAQDRKSVV